MASGRRYSYLKCDELDRMILLMLEDSAIYDT